MKIINYIIIIFIVCSGLYSIDKGYYIYKFGIDSNDSISLYNSKFIDAKLKVSQVEKHIHNPILYKLINTENNILFEGGLINPKIIYYEEMIDEPHTKSTFILDSAYFIIKVPVFDNVDKIEFFKSNGNSVLQNPLIFASLPVYEKYHLTILYSYLFHKYNIYINYINSSNFDELTGNRSIEIPAEIKNSFIQTILSKESNSMQTSATYFNTDINFPFDNIIPFNTADTLDLDALGFIQGAHKGGSIEFNYSNNNYQLLLGLGLGNLSGSVEMVTPVLGKILLSFPISHGVGGEITGTNSSQKISFNYNKLYKNIKFELLSSYTHGYYDLLIDGDAQLLYDLFSTPVFYTLNYHAHFFDFKGNIKQQIGNINIIYSLNQIIPIIWRTDSSPIKFKYESPIDPTPTEPGISYETEVVNFWEWDYISENLNKHRGGRSYSISIQYSW